MKSGGEKENLLGLALFFFCVLRTSVTTEEEQKNRHGRNLFELEFGRRRRRSVISAAGSNLRLPSSLDFLLLLLLLTCP